MIGAPGDDICTLLSLLPLYSYYFYLPSLLHPSIFFILVVIWYPSPGHSQFFNVAILKQGHLHYSWSQLHGEVYSKKNVTIRSLSQRGDELVKTAAAPLPRATLMAPVSVARSITAEGLKE
jgi:hypothetical protein